MLPQLYAKMTHERSNVTCVTIYPGDHKPLCCLDGIGHAKNKVMAQEHHPIV